MADGSRDERRARLRILTVGDGTVASARYRVLAYLPALRAAGFDAEVRFEGRKKRSRAARRLLRLFDLMRETRWLVPEDLLFVHRKTFPPPFAAGLRSKRRPIVFDMDDALDLPPPGRAATDSERERFRSNFEATLSAADLVLCGNAELAARLPHERYEILPTPIDTERFRPGAVPVGREPWVGWVGRSDNLGYLETLAEPLREVARRHPGFRLIVVADRGPALPGLHVEFRRWTLENEISCFSGMRIGLMPLEDDAWSRGKCAFKAIQYMALGIPAVASPVGMNREVIRDGESGFLPESPADWVAALDRLLSDSALRERIAANGRAAVEVDYSLTTMSARLIDILRAVLKREGRGRR